MLHRTIAIAARLHRYLRWLLKVVMCHPLMFISSLSACASCSMSCLRQYVNGFQQLPRVKSVASASRRRLGVGEASARVCISATDLHSHGASSICEGSAQAAEDQSTEDQSANQHLSKNDPVDCSDEQLPQISIPASANPS